MTMIATAAISMFLLKSDMRITLWFAPPVSATSIQ
jgi:hypothetical protein